MGKPTKKFRSQSDRGALAAAGWYMKKRVEVSMLISQLSDGAKAHEQCHVYLVHIYLSFPLLKPMNF